MSERQALPGRWVVGLAVVLLAGCGRMDVPGGAEGQGPGRRQQQLALTPAEELELGRKAYAEILSQSEVVRRGPEVDRVRQIGERIVRAARIRPLQRELNVRYKEQWFEWEFAVVRARQVNAFCLPGGKVVVFTGILPVAGTDDQLATVMAHEIAHALAHHASERVAVQQMLQPANQALHRSFSSLNPEERDRLFGVLAAGSGFRGRSYEREQETEADHIGVFLMTFAGYDPDQAVAFWQRMQRAAAGQPRPPEIFSDHPSDERRIAQLRGWVPYARAAKKAYEEGRIVPEAR